MEKSTAGAVAKKRPKIMKRWTKENLEIVINYLATTGRFEKPTSKAYYHQMAKDLQDTLKTTWTILYWKVRYLKKTFIKAEAWKASKAAQKIQEKCGNDEYEEKLLKICPFFYTLKDIFVLPNTIKPKLDDSDVSSVSQCTQQETQQEELRLPESMELISENCDTQIKIQFSPEQSPRTVFDTHFTEVFDHNKIFHSEQPIANDSNHPDDAQNFKYKLEKLKLEKETELNKEKLKYEFEIRKQELELRRMEIEQDEKLKILEMNKNERLAKYELELKYKVNVSS